MKKSVISSVVLSLLLAACGSAKDASKSNFEKAINAHLAKQCVTLRPGGYLSLGKSYPVEVALEKSNKVLSQEQMDKINLQNTRPYDALVKAGLLTVKDGSTKPSGWAALGSTGENVPAKIYSLTDAGRKALVDPSGNGTNLCAGHYKVGEIVRFTEPSNAMGHTISQVSYTFSPVDVPGWAKSDDMKKAFDGLSRDLTDNQKGQAMLVLANDGWVEASDFAQ